MVPHAYCSASTKGCTSMDSPIVPCSGASTTNNKKNNNANNLEQPMEQLQAALPKLRTANASSELPSIITSTSLSLAHSELPPLDSKLKPIRELNLRPDHAPSSPQININKSLDVQHPAQSKASSFSSGASCGTWSPRLMPGRTLVGPPSAPHEQMPSSLAHASSAPGPMNLLPVPAPPLGLGHALSAPAPLYNIGMVRRPSFECANGNPTLARTSSIAEVLKSILEEPLVPTDVPPMDPMCCMLNKPFFMSGWGPLPSEMEHLLSVVEESGLMMEAEGSSMDFMDALAPPVGAPLGPAPMGPYDMGSMTNPSQGLQHLLQPVKVEEEHMHHAGFA